MADHTRPEITIIGAGPAGISAALALGKKGIPCLLTDKSHFPREKICGDGLSGKVVSTLNKLNPEYAIELGAKEFATASQAVRFFSPGAKMMELSFTEDIQSHASGFVCKRIDFDKFLLDKAQANPGFQFLGGVRASKISRDKGMIILEDANGESFAETRLLIVATGMDKLLLNQLGPGSVTPSSEGIGIRGYFENVSGSDHNHAIEIHFLAELLPWYLWIFPFADGSANVGLALPEHQAKKKKQSLKELLYQLIERYPHLKPRFAQAKLTGKIEAGRLPYYNGPGRISGDNYMLLGDAARLIDPFTGEGIGNAMVSGLVAAEVAAECLANGDFSEKSTAVYHQRIYKKLGPELSLGLKLQGLAKNRFLLNLVIGRASRDRKLRDTISEMLYSDEAKNKLRNPLFYLKLLSGI